MAPEWPSTRYRNEAARAWPRGCVHATRGTRGRRGKENIRSRWSRKVIRVFFGDDDEGGGELSWIILEEG